jgi:CubicO group peptidase (beta-lactamase class C family)
MRTQNISRQKTDHRISIMPAVLPAFHSTVPLVTLLALVTTTGAVAQSKNDARIELSSADKIQGWMADYKVPTVGVAVIEGGKVKDAKVFGELRKGVPAPLNTIFGVASLSKPITAILALLLINAGEWDLDEPLLNHWVEPDVADDPRLKKLTTRLVLSHQSGFPNWRRGKLAFEFEPGTKFQYSGEGFEYLRRAIERKFQKPLGKIAEQLLFAPLGMKDTGYQWTDAMDQFRIAIAKDLAGHNIFPWIPTTANAASSILTTAEDYGKFGAEVIRGAGLSQKLYGEMIRPHVAIPGPEGYSYGLGWVVAKDLSNGEYALLHRGGHQGVRTLVILLPKSRRGLVVLTNGEQGEALCNKITLESLDLGKAILKGSEITANEKQADASKHVYVKLVHADTGKILAIADNSDDPGANAVLAKDDGALAHQWRFEKQGDYYKIVNRKSGKVLDVYMESTEEGGAIIQWNDKTGAANDNQLWSWDGKDGARRLKSKFSALVLDIGLDNAIIQRKANDNIKSQLWRVVEIKEQQK